MIKRQYFLSVRVAHNNNTGCHSWWNCILTSRCWIQNKESLLVEAREVSVEKLQCEVERVLNEQDIEVLALNKI